MHPSFLPRRTVYHEYTILLENVSDHTGQLSTVVHPQIVEKTIRTTQLLQIDRVIRWTSHTRHRFYRRLLNVGIVPQ